MTAELGFEHKVGIGNPFDKTVGPFANTVGSVEAITAMYPSADVYSSRLVYDAGQSIDAGHGVRMTPFNSLLRFKDLPDGRRAILGGTLTRGCAVAPNCGSCALSASGMSVEDMAELNCARANTARAFEAASLARTGRFVLLPTGKDAYVVDDDRLDHEYAGDRYMQSRLKPAPAVVLTESWLREQGLRYLSVGMNGADGSMGVATTKIAGEVLLIPFCSMRPNMGDRDEDDQILRQALNAYFDSKEIGEEERVVLLQKATISINLAASASLANFAHKIRVPGEAEDAPEKERSEAARLRRAYPDLVRRAGNKITSAIVLNDQFPGAMGRESIYPELEAKMGIHETPITPDNCPGDGQTCHVDYRAETRYALVKQLQEMGIPDANIVYDDSQAMDPGSPDNTMASNRAEQNEGIPVANTNRTLNGMKISLSELISAA